MQNFIVFKWASEHPRLAAWLVLSVGMSGILATQAWDVGLQVTQWIALMVACVLVAGICVWIISWEDEEPTEVPTNLPQSTNE